MAEEGGEEALLDSLQRWTNACFERLPEHPNSIYEGGGSPSPFSCSSSAASSRPICLLTFGELERLFACYCARLQDSSLSAGRSWLGGAVPLSVRRNMATGPGWDKDCLTPYARRMVIEADETLVFVGDLHGSIHSLLRSLVRWQAAGMIDDRWSMQEAGGQRWRLCFLGDFVDRGAYGVEVWATVMKLYCSNPDQVSERTHRHTTHA